MSTNSSWNAEYNNAKGALLVGDGSRPIVRTVGADGTVLTANSANPDGVEWGAGNSATTAWTPVLAFGGASTGITYALRAAYYVKSGNLISINGLIQLSSKGTATGNATITGLPFSSNSASNNFCYYSVMYGSIILSTFAQTFNMRQSPGTAIINIYQSRTGAGNTVIDCTDANFTNSTTFEFGGCYFV